MDLVVTPYYALSISQPWAWAILHAHKRIENRNWPARPGADWIGRRIALHAAKSWDGEGADLLRRRSIPCPMRVELPAGAIVGVATIARVFHLDDVDLRKEDPADLPWMNGPLCLQLADVVRLDQPVRAKGALGFWYLPDDAREAVRRQLEARR